MSLDRAILLPREFDKEDSRPIEGTDMGAVEVLHSPTKNAVRSRETGEHARDQVVEKPTN